VRPFTIAHLSDPHFGGVADLLALEVAAGLVRALAPDATVVSGDLTLRARHGELQAARLYVDSLASFAPTLVVPGNHDIQWWKSPFHLLGRHRISTKWRRWFGEELAPVLRIPGAVIAGALSANGLSPGSLTTNPNDMTVKGDLPARETRRLAQLFASLPPEVFRVVVVHHNVLRGNISQRMGLAHWKSAQRRLVATGADVVLCGHDHEEGAGQIDGKLPVSTASTLSTRARLQRPVSFNVVRLSPDRVEIEYFRWDAGPCAFRASDRSVFARTPRGDAATRAAAPA
jgi:3',5'-cyclic AMP phosphodiesterase CpdA